MSGAFNIDIEVGQIDKTKIKIYCATLTDTWDVERTQTQFTQFYSDLGQQDAVRKNKINLRQKCPSIADVNDCELFLSRLGCTAAILRITLFHDFLQIPQSNRDGLKYASHKAFGKSLREGHMQRHPRFVRRGGGSGKRYIRLTKDDRGGSLICYMDESKKQIHSSFKIGASTELQNLKEKGIQNAFVLKSGKRQWILQASSSRDYTSWQSQLFKLLKEFGPLNLDNNASDKKSARKSSDNANDGSYNRKNNRANTAQKSANAGKLLQEKVELTNQINKMNKEMLDLESEIDRYKDLEIEMKTSEAELKRKGQKRFQREKEELIATYEVKQDNLRAEIELLHQKLEQKTAEEGGRSGLKSLFGDDYIVIDIKDYKENGSRKSNKNNNNHQLAYGGVDDESEESEDSDEGIGGTNNNGGGGGRTNTGGGYVGDEDDESQELNGKSDSHIKYLHKHLHRHDHKHIHDHRHTHIHDQRGKEPVTYTHTHTIAHTITHTMTQFKIKKNTFGL